MELGRILAVDDDRFFRELYLDILGRQGYTVDTVADGAACLQKLEANAYDLVVLDLILDDMTGIELAAKIRERDRGLEIMMATKVDDLASINKAMELGIKEYILKPIHEAEFVQTVAGIMERQKVFLEHGKLLAESVEYFYTLSMYKRCLAILGMLDIDPLVELITDGCMQESEAVGAIVWLREDGEKGLFKEVARRGLVDADELSEFTYSEYRQHDQLLKEIPFFPRKPGSEANELDRDAIHIPLIRNKELLAIVKLCRKVNGRFRNKDLQSLRMLGEFSAIALQNALAVQELKRRSSRGENFILLPDRFSALLERERATALRYNRAFSLVEINLPPGRVDIEAFLQEHLREADAVTQTSPGVYRFFLPETDGIGARSFGRRFLGALRTKGLVAGAELPVPIHASFPGDGEGLADLENSLATRRKAYQASLVKDLKKGDFALVCNELVEGHALHGELFDKNTFMDAVHFLMTDIESDPRRRTALFLGLGRIASHRNWLEERLFSLGKMARISLFGDATDFRLPESIDNVVTIHVPAPAGLETYFALYLTPESGYVALYQREGGLRRGFHLQDEFLADSLILALQEQYYLQRQL